MQIDLPPLRMWMAMYCLVSYLSVFEIQELLMDHSCTLPLLQMPTMSSACPIFWR